MAYKKFLTNITGHKTQFQMLRIELYFLQVVSISCKEIILPQRQAKVMRCYS